MKGRTTSNESDGAADFVEISPDAIMMDTLSASADGTTEVAIQLKVGPSDQWKEVFEHLAGDTAEVTVEDGLPVILFAYRPPVLEAYNHLVGLVAAANEQMRHVVDREKAVHASALRDLEAFTGKKK